MTKPVKQVETMGERLRRQALWLAERHQVSMPWRSMVAATLQRDTARTQPVRAHGRRIEARLPVDTALRATHPGTTDAPIPPAMPRMLPDPLARQAPRMRLHEGPVADAVARGHRADAVTIGQDVFLRDQPGTSLRDRLPLLAHEATHVSGFLDPHAAWHRSTSAGLREEENRASESERIASRSPLIPEPRPSPTPPPATPTPAAASASSPSLRPMAAETNRNPVPTPGFAAPASSGVDMRSIREGLMRDIIDSVRIDAERGG